MATSNYVLPLPQAVRDSRSTSSREKWKRFKRAWISYALATKLKGKDEAVQVATLLTVIGEEAREVFFLRLDGQQTVMMRNTGKVRLKFFFFFFV